MLVSLAPCRCVSLPLLLLAPDCWTEARLLLGSCQSGRPGVFWVKRCPHDAHDSSGRHGPMMLILASGRLATSTVAVAGSRLPDPSTALCRKLPVWVTWRLLGETMPP